MTLRDFLETYDFQEGDLIECENGEIYELSYLCDGKWALHGPKPEQFKIVPAYHIKSNSKRLLRPRWKGLSTNGLVCWLHLEVLQPKQQKKTLKCEEREEHIRCVRCGARFGISEPYYWEPYIADKRYPQHCTTCADILFKTNLDRVNWRCLNQDEH